MIYAQKGHGRRADLYTDYTFAVWDGDKLVPFAKAYSGLTDAEINKVDYFIKRNTLKNLARCAPLSPSWFLRSGLRGLTNQRAINRALPCVSRGYCAGGTISQKRKPIHWSLKVLGEQ
jgi:hypothetical protein